MHADIYFHALFVLFTLSDFHNQILQNFDAAIVRSDTKITAEVLAAGAGSLKVVGRAGAGVDNIDVAAATSHNVVVLK